ncbi:hypothetical protein BBW65_03250 [Helicobacter enhydrae]|uniref:Na+/H+ antiporter NhaC-like C-terminal domain-containing protein n=2 Tax=Helicobacter enhydrae TaxID=222136 RepID=A0A1B1U7G6_9HELI|nr:hypothetical protein BBW65_03250 [Helicobacter enhydrae]
MVLWTKKIIPSLLVGIVLGGAIIHRGDFWEILGYIYHKFSSVFYTFGEQGFELNWEKLYIFLFLIFLGILSEMIIRSGGIGAFVQWARGKIKDTRSSEIVVFIAGVIIFIDDYFNALTVGQITQPFNHLNYSSKERFAYIVDSTSAPICIIIPFSSWGAYIVGLLSESLPPNTSGALLVLLECTLSNFYAWFALLGVILTIWWQINLPVMQKNFNVGSASASQHQEEIPSGSISMLFVPILVLIVSIIFMIFYTGCKSSQSSEILKILDATDTYYSLFVGGIVALAVAFVMSLRIKNLNYAQICLRGVKSMCPAIVILIFAAVIGSVIKDLKTGEQLAFVAKEFLSQESLKLLPIFLFCISAFIAFATGTSWGCFAIMIPIAIEFSLQGGTNSIFAISAVLAGAVYGDHTSPMSDTTILSSVGTGCSLQSHFITQLPYAGISAGCALLGFMMLSFTQSVALAFLGSGIVFLGIFYALKQRFSQDLGNIKA